MMYLLQALLVFTVVAVGDVFWTKYISEVNAGHRVRAALWSASIVMIGSVSIIAYTEDHHMVLPAAAGAFFGTLFSVETK